MNQPNHTSILANVSGNRGSNLHVYRSRRGRHWLRILISALVLSSILLSPVGSIPASALVAPDLVAPADNSTTTVVDTPPLAIPEFEWAAVPGATSYHLQVSGNIGFTTQIVNITTPNTTYTPIIANSFTDGNWYWRVRVETPAPVSDYSNTWSFTKQWATPENLPTLISPDNAATIDFYDQPVFSWGAVTGAAKYKLQIYSSPEGYSTLRYTATTLATTHQPKDKLANGTYYWRVVPIDPDTGNHDGTPSEERSFTANYNPVLTLLAPNPNAVTYPTFTPTFRWTAVRGAEYYKLQYSTDPSFPANSLTATINTRNTAYTPIVAMSNDTNYYWRVSVYSGGSISAWTTASAYFRKQWYIKPELLTPTKTYQDQRFPMFSWTPVPGAAWYHFELSTDAGFSGTLIDKGDTANTFWTPHKYYGSTPTYWWRVTPYDGAGNQGVTSEEFSYNSSYASVAPHQVYPLYYYPPDTYTGFPGVTTNPHEDRTVPLPIFIWHRVSVPALGGSNQGDVYAAAYRLQVSHDATFGVVDWTVDTENLVAAPTAGQFTPSASMDYYWRVCPLPGTCGSGTSPWSQVWKTRIDLSRGLTPTGGAAPTLIRPTNGFEFAETTPLLEWFPMSGASSYDVEISLDSTFSSTVDTASVSYPAYAPPQSLAQRSLGGVDFGIYYWRVRKSPSGAWSETRRFQIAAQSQWLPDVSTVPSSPPVPTRTLGSLNNRLQIGSDPAGEVGVAADYDLTDLQVAQSSNYWYFGFHVPAAPSSPVTYALYLDLDHKDSSGATSDAFNFGGSEPYSVTTIPAYRPEYAIYVVQELGAFTATKAYLYAWNGSSWGTRQVFTAIGGLINQSGDYVELGLQSSSIGYGTETGSYAVSLFSLPGGNSGGAPQDSVPSDPNVPGTGVISRFSNVTERMNLLMPPNNAGVDPSTYPSILPFFWDWSILAPWSGAFMKAYVDPLFTTEVASYEIKSTGAFYASPSQAVVNDFGGDNTYYWRVQPRYRPSLTGGSLVNGAWSQGWSFERRGFVPQNLQTSVTFATPTFSWDMVEGAKSYDLQVSTDPAFGGTPPININTNENSYTDLSTLPNAIYYWRVRARRYPSVINGWTSNQSFTLALPTPAGLNHKPLGVVGRAPTLCWTPLIQSSAGNPVLAAWKYRVQVSKEPTFSSIFDTIDTEQSCWTPTKGYDDGQYYWRAAMIDGKNRLGDYSAYETFTKQYPITTLVSPLNGAGVGGTPTFAWTPVNGAARYILQTSLYSNFSPTVDLITTYNTRYTPTKTYAGGGKIYYWRVAIVDDDAKIGPYNDATVILGYRVYLPLVKR